MIIVIIDIVYTRGSTAVAGKAASQTQREVKFGDMARYVSCEPAVIARMFSLVADLVWMLQLLKVAKIGP